MKTNNRRGLSSSALGINTCILLNVYDHYFQTSSLKPLGQSKPDFVWSLLGWWEIVLINGTGHMTKMATMLIYDKNFQKSHTELIVL